MGGFEAIESGGPTSRLYSAGDFRPEAAGVVVFHAWWGLNDDIVAYADRLAAAGFATGPRRPSSLSSVRSTSSDATWEAPQADRRARVVDTIGLTSIRCVLTPSCQGTNTSTR